MLRSGVRGPLRCTMKVSTGFLLGEQGVISVKRSVYRSQAVLGARCPTADLGVPESGSKRLNGRFGKSWSCVLQQHIPQLRNLGHDPWSTYLVKLCTRQGKT